MEFREHKLANGLTVIAELNPKCSRRRWDSSCETGARDESDGVAGVSHFLEHMVFKGNAQHAGRRREPRASTRWGPTTTPSPAKKCTVYYAAVLPEYQTPAVQLLADVLRPSLRDEDFDTEKKVIIEEIRMYEDPPPFGADDKCKAAHFGKHPLGP